MKKSVALPALALAAVFIAHPACAASNKKSAPASADASTPSAAKWAKMPAGNKHTLRKNIGIRSADQKSWKINTKVTLSAGGNDPQCIWDGHVDAKGKPQIKPKSLGGATLVVDTDFTPPRMSIVLSDGTPINRDLAYGDSAADSRWLSSTPDNDWNYYVMFKDTNPSANPKDSIDKYYRVEIFPPKNKTQSVHAHCDPERPEEAVAVARVDEHPRSAPCEAGTGSGGEPGGHN